VRVPQAESTMVDKLIKYLWMSIGWTWDIVVEGRSKDRVRE